MSALLQAARSAWPFNDGDILDMGVEDGIVWATARSPLGSINGYALIPAEGHPWSNGVPTYDTGYEFEEHISERDLRVHGGVTYGAEGPWIGFDCLHLGDVWPPEYDPSGISRPSGTAYEKRWTPELVVKEAKSLARQIAAVTA